MTDYSQLQMARVADKYRKNPRKKQPKYADRPPSSKQTRDADGQTPSTSTKYADRPPSSKHTRDADGQTPSTSTKDADSPPSSKQTTDADGQTPSTSTKDADRPPPSKPVGQPRPTHPFEAPEAGRIVHLVERNYSTTLSPESIGVLLAAADDADARRTIVEAAIRNVTRAAGGDTRLGTQEDALMLINQLPRDSPLEGLLRFQYIETQSCTSYVTDEQKLVFKRWKPAAKQCAVIWFLYPYTYKSDSGEVLHPHADNEAARRWGCGEWPTEDSADETSEINTFVRAIKETAGEQAQTLQRLRDLDRNTLATIAKQWSLATLPMPVVHTLETLTTIGPFFVVQLQGANDGRSVPFADLKMPIQNLRQFSTKRGVQYELVSTIFKTGNVGSGHWVAMTQAQCADTKSRVWYVCDDDNVKSIQTSARDPVGLAAKQHRFDAMGLAYASETSGETLAPCGLLYQQVGIKRDPIPPPKKIKNSRQTCYGNALVQFLHPVLTLGAKVHTIGGSDGSSSSQPISIDDD
jgi:hypothetical protein